jgi:hypothetical protein
VLNLIYIHVKPVSSRPVLEFADAGADYQAASSQSVVVSQQLQNCILKFAAAAAAADAAAAAAPGHFQMPQSSVQMLELCPSSS